MVVRNMPTFVQDNEEETLRNFPLKIWDVDVHVTISNGAPAAGEKSKSDMMIHSDGAARWGREETRGGRLVSYYSTEISRAQEIDFINRVDLNKYQVPSPHLWRRIPL